MTWVLLDAVGGGGGVGSSSGDGVNTVFTKILLWRYNRYDRYDRYNRYLRTAVSIERLLHTFPHPAVLVMVKKVPMAANIC